MSTTIIKADGLSKAYRIGLKEEIPDTLVGAATSWLKSPLRNFNRLRKLNTFAANGDENGDVVWALRDVSFEVGKGEVLGVIGRNGAGKSTLLKILSRITEPTQGRAIVEGRISTLLEVGTGFHPELTGRENVYMNGTILGMRKREIDQKFDEIADFSGVAKFLDTPVKRYSSGMKVRLAFSVAAHLEPEVLIIDEVLAVGDAEFQKKCLGKMEMVAGGGRTVLFVSHNIAAIQALCSRALYLEGGRCIMNAATKKVIDAYAATVQSAFTVLNSTNHFEGRKGSGEVRYSSVKLFGEHGEADKIPIGSATAIELVYSADGIQRNCNFGIHVRDMANQVIFRLTTMDSMGVLLDVSGTGLLRCHIDALPLLPGHYQIALFIKRGDSPDLIDHVATALEFDVISSDVNGTGYLPRIGVCHLPTEWTFHQTHTPSQMSTNYS